MKIALAQLNYTIGDFKENQNKIVNAISKAKAEQCNLIVFSELSVCGYPPLDLLENKDFIERSYQVIEAIAKECVGITAIVGAPKWNEQPQGKKLFNAGFVLANGKIQESVCKTLLPTYDIFDEYRYFEPNTVFKTVKIGNKQVALTICEDLWDDQPTENTFDRNQLYTQSPLEKIHESFDLIINIAASPFSVEQDQIRKQILTQKAKQYQKPLIYVNQAAANTELIFDGQSMLIDKNGVPVYELKRFEEDFYIFDCDQLNNRCEPEKEDHTELLYKALKKGLKDYFGKMNFKKAVLGLSGGIDSALVATIATDVLGKENVVGILMPSKFSSEHSVSDAVQLAENLGIEHHIIPIKSIVESFDQTLEPLFSGTNFGVAEENIQARSRGVILMAYSNKFGHILLNTSNKSEAAVGYSTLYGDMNGSISLLGDVYKTEVFALSKYINRNQEIIPWNTINKPPSAELRPDQKDSDSLPDYDTLDQILKLYIEKKESRETIIAKGFDKDTVQKTILMVNRNEYKRFQSPPIIRVTPKAFGLGRRMPLVAKYDF